MADESIPNAATEQLDESPSVIAPGSLHGWSALQQAINYTLPNLLTQAERRRQATMRLLGNG